MLDDVEQGHNRYGSGKKRKSPCIGFEHVPGRRREVYADRRYPQPLKIPHKPPVLRPDIEHGQGVLHENERGSDDLPAGPTRLPADPFDIRGWWKVDDHMVRPPKNRVYGRKFGGAMGQPQRARRGGPHLLRIASSNLFARITTLARANLLRLRLFSYVLPALAAFIAMQTWFRAGTFIAHGDISPFVRDAVSADAGSMWGHQATAAGAPSLAQAGGLVETAIIRTAHILGGSEEFAQRSFYTLILVSVAVAGVYFAYAFVSRPLPAAAAGLVTVFNPFVLQSHSPLILWAVALMGLSGGLVLRAAQRKRLPGVWFGILSLGASYLAQNPPLLVVVIAWVLFLAALGSVLTTSGGSRRAFGFLLRAAPWCLLLNLWWLVPFAYALLNPIGSRFAVATGVEAFRFTQERTSIANVLTLSSSWGWRYPEYFPYASTLDQPWWSPLKYALPLIALSAPLVSRRRQRLAALVLVGAAAVVILLSKGLHPPLSSFNLGLYRYVPGMWLLREPNGKLGPILLLVYAALAAIALEAVSERLRHRAGPRIRALWWVSAAAVVATLAYPWPLWTGKVMTDHPQLAASDHVRIPTGWRSLAEAINNSGLDGRVLLLPLDAFYQVPTTWGYYGTDAIPRLLLREPTIKLTPGGGYFGPTPGYESLVTSVQGALLTGDVAAVPPLLRSLGASFVILRNDINTGFNHGFNRILSPNRLRPALDATPGLKLVGKFGVAALYEVEGPAIGTIHTAASVVRVGSSDDYQSVPSVVGDLRLDQASTSDEGARTEGEVDRPRLDLGPIEARRTNYGSPFDLAGDQSVLLELRSASNGIYRVSTERSHAGAKIVVENATQVLLDGDSVRDPLHWVVSVAGGSPRWITVDGELFPLRGRPLVPMHPGSSMIVYAGDPSETPRTSLGPVGDCNHQPGRTLSEAGIVAHTLDSGPSPAVELQAVLDSACVNTPRVTVVPGVPNRIRFQYRTVAGSTARLCVFQYGPSNCAALPALTAARSWQSYDQTFVPSSGTSQISLFLYADHGDGQTPTITQYEDVSVERLPALATRTLPFPTEQPGAMNLGQGPHDLEVSLPLQASLSDFSQVSDCYRYDTRSPTQVGIGARLLPPRFGPAVQLRANSHAACVSAALQPALAGLAYDLRFEYRTLSGKSARICVWQRGPNRCASIPRLSASPGWQRYDAVVVPDPGTVALHLFLYAFGANGHTTVTEYRNVDVEIASPIAPSLVHTAPPRAPPPVTFSRSGPTTYVGHVAESASPFVLQLAESYAPGWELSGLPASRSAQHIELDGYANGWLVPAGPAFGFEIRYGPDAWYAVTRSLSLFALAIAIGFVALRRRVAPVVQLAVAKTRGELSRLPHPATLGRRAAAFAPFVVRAATEMTRLGAEAAIGTTVRGIRTGRGAARTLRLRAVARVASISIPVAAAYVLPAVLAFGVTASWFRAGAFVASGDVPPFVRAGVAYESGSLWGHQYTGAGSPSYQGQARTPEILFLKLAHLLGASDPTAQRYFYSILVALLVIGAVYLALAFIENAPAAALAGLFAVFNPFVLQYVMNPLVPWALASMAFAGGMVVRAARGVSVSPIGLALISVAGVYLALNPPLLVVLTVWVIVLAALGTPLTGLGGTKRAVAFLARAAPWVILFNLWWLVPFAFTLIHRDTGQVFSAQTDVGGWAFTQRRNTIANVTTLSSGWQWGLAEYEPFTRHLDSAVWTPLKFALPLLAFSAPLAVRRDARRAPTILASLALVLIFFSKGLHAPFGEVNRFLYEHVPGMWLLREPNTKLGIPLVLLYVVLAAITVHALLTKGRESRALLQAGRAFAVGMVVWALAYPYPLWSGAVVPDSRPLLPSAHVRIPDAWYRLASHVNRSPDTGKVLLLPLNDYYQVPTDWGYYGEDDVPRWLLQRPTVQLLPEEYFQDQPGFSSLVRAFQDALIAGDVQSATRLLQSLGVSEVIVRSDIITDFPRREFAATQQILPTLRSIPGMSLVDTEPVGTLFRFSPPRGDTVQVYSTLLTAEGPPSAQLPAGISGTPSTSAVSTINGPGEGTLAIARPGASSLTVDINQAGTFELTRLPFGVPLYHAAVEQKDGESYLQLDDATTVSVGDRMIEDLRPILLPLSNARVFALEIGRSAYPLQPVSPVIPGKPGTPIQLLGLRAGSTGSTLSALSRVTDCKLAVPESGVTTGMSSSQLPSGGTLAVRISTTNQPACVTTHVRHSLPGQAFVVSLDYRTLSGASAQICLFQDGPDTCAQLPPLHRSGAWTHFQGVVVTSDQTTGLQLALEAPAPTEAGPTIAEYRRLSVRTLGEVGTVTLPSLQQSREIVALERGRQLLRAETSLQTTVSPLSDVADCNKVDSRSMVEVGIRARTFEAQSASVVELQARDHAACVHEVVTPVLPGAAYRVHVDYRTISGTPARICVWQEGPGTCAQLPPLTAADNWRHYDQTFLLAPRTTGLELFLYADGGAGGTTTTQYRAPRIDLAPPITMTLLKQPPPSTSPNMSWTKTGPTSYDVLVAGSRYPYLLTLAESYAGGWELQGIPPGRSATHVLIDGYANGWRIGPGPALDVSIVYGPDRWSGLARSLSLLAGVIALVVVTRRKIRSALGSEGSRPSIGT
jgi:arabinofuranan 3-O-arabinosyltransferase